MPIWATRAKAINAHARHAVMPDQVQGRKVMKVLHLTGWPIPETLAGTEIYVLSLCRALAARRITSEIACLDVKQAGTQSEYAGVVIHRFGSAGTPAQADAVAFSRWLGRIDPDVVHVQAVTEGLGRAEVEAAVAAGYPVVLTTHVPGIVCLRGTMMRYGVAPCDGEMLASRCAACCLQERGLPSWAAQSLMAIPESMRLGLAGLAPRKLATALRRTASVRQQFADVHALFDGCQRVIAVCQWLYDALRINGVPESKLVFSRQAAELPESLQPRRERQPGEPLRVGYIGRYDPIKGVDVIMRAVAALPRESRVSLVLHGTADARYGGAFLARLQAIAAADSRITLGGALPRGELADFFASIDLLAVPSTWLETGPIVVYEAFAHRVPVLGSRLGGIAELVRDGKDGWLVTAGDVTMWQKRLLEIFQCAATLPSLESPPPVLRTWNQAAEEMEAVYRAVAAVPTGL
jgi:glycosyltransferase involved in cell wall biosynthesis